LENVARELAIMCALLNNDKIIDFTELLPNLGELHQHQLSKKRADADVSEIIAFAANRAAARGIISVLGMVKHLLHEPVERLWSTIPNLGSDKLDKSGVSRLRPQRPTLNSETSASKRSPLNTQLQ
jgi:hypothetical protein